MINPISGELRQSQVSNLKKRIENDYMLDKAEYQRTVTASQSLLLNYQHNYNSHINSQSNGVSNQIMFAQHGETGYNKGDGNRSSRDPGEIWTTSLAKIVEKNVIMLGTMNDQLNPISKGV